jgi:hypothetical protein
MPLGRLMLSLVMLASKDRCPLLTFHLIRLRAGRGKTRVPRNRVILVWRVGDDGLLGLEANMLSD